MDTMTIGQLAKVSGVAPRTIRFYEAKGILPKPRRSQSAYRLYDHSDLRRLTVVRRARALGFGLTEAKAILRAAEREECSTFQGQVGESMARKLEEVGKMIDHLETTRAELRKSIDFLKSCECDWGDCRQAAFECGTECLGA